jgi:dihydromonapterin reductase/dihydrofolate reductase
VLFQQRVAYFERFNVLKNTIIITGAGRRVGFHMAQRFHEQGYTVLAHYRSETDEIKALEAMGVATIQADLSSTQAILTFVDEVQTRCLSIRAIVHNASAFTPSSTDLREAAEQYQQFFMIHMMAPYLINEGLKELMAVDNAAADIVHITDINVENPTESFDSYCSTKAGLQNMTLSLAKKYAPKIKVNAVAPGPVLFAEMHNPELRKQLLAETPLGREGGAEPVFLAVASLLDNPFITAATIPVDGGRRLTKR